MPLQPRVTSPDPLVNKGDGYAETLGSSLLLEVWDEHGKRQHAWPSIPGGQFMQTGASRDAGTRQVSTSMC